MRGIPSVLATKQDYLNAVAYAKANPDVRELVRERLTFLKNISTMKVLKSSSTGKKAEDQTPSDYEDQPDPGCLRERLGFSSSEIDSLLRGL